MGKHRATEAAWIRVGLCNSCDNVHITLLDEAQRPYAAGILSPAQWAKVVTDIETRRAIINADDGVGKPVGSA